MITTTPEPVKLWGRGQLTIPKAVRQALHLEEEDHLSVFVVGRCMVLTPKRLLRVSLAKDVQRAMKAKHLTLKDVLKTLKEERRRYVRQAHGG